jgi:hypothetical protein
MDENDKRGLITNRERASQQKDYSGLRWSKITPSDIDGAVEFSDRLFVFLEYKHAGAPMQYGQRLCAERIVKAIAETGRHALFVVADHYSKPDEDIDGAGSIVRQVYYDGKWSDMKKTTVREAIDSFCEAKLGWIP